MGLHLLTQHLKALSNRRVRQSARKWTSSRWSGCLWGVLAGALTQTMPALTFITIGMLRSGILTPGRAFPILIGGNIGAVMLLLVVSFDIKLVVLYALGASQLATLVATRGRSSGVKLQACSATLFAMGMMVLGFVLIKESALPLANHPLVPGVCGTGGEHAGPVPPERCSAEPPRAVYWRRDGDRDRHGDHRYTDPRTGLHAARRLLASGQA